jgi:hypothetical protein
MLSADSAKQLKGHGIDRPQCGNWQWQLQQCFCTMSGPRHSQGNTVWSNKSGLLTASNAVVWNIGHSISGDGLVMQQGKQGMF